MFFHRRNKRIIGEDKHYHLNHLPILFGVLMLLLLSAFTYAIPSDWCTYQSPIAAWQLTSDVNDCSGNARHFTNNGATLTGTDADLESTESDYLTITNPSWMNLGSSDFTMCMNFTRESTEGHILQRWTVTDKGFRWGSQLTTTYFQYSGFSHSISIDNLNSNSFPFCVRYNNSMLYVFNKTELIYTSAVASSNLTPDGAANLVIGRRDYGADGYYDGKVNHVTIYSQALTDTQIGYLWGSSTSAAGIQYSQTNLTSTIEGTSTTFTLIFTNSSQVHSNSTAVFIINNTRYPTTDNGINFTSTVVTNLETLNYSSYQYKWEYNATLTNGTILNENTTSTTFNNYRIKITDDCTTLTTTKTLNLSFKDELSNAELSADIEISFRSYYLNSSHTRYDAFSYSNIYSKQFCISPSTAQYTTDITALYTKTGFSSREWYEDDYSLSSTHRLQTLYLLSTGNQSSVTVHVSDASDNALANIRVDMERWNLPQDNYSVVESELTSSEGEAVFTYQSTAFYRFKLYQDGVLRSTTDKAKITSTDLYYRISEGETSTLLKGIQVRSIDSNLTYNYATETLTFVWIDSADYTSQVCVNLTSTGNSTAIFGQCSTASSGTITYVLTRGNTSYYAFSYGTHTDGGQFNMDSLGIEARQLWQDLGEDTGFITLMIVLVFGLIGVANALIGLILVLVSLFVVWSLETAYIDQTIFTFAALVEIILFWLMLRRER